MKKVCYLTMPLKDGYIIDNNNDLVYEDEFSLYYITADDNKIFYKKPKIDYPDHYTFHYYNSEKEIPLQEYLKQKELLYNTTYCYLIISTNCELLSVEEMKIQINENYFSIPIDKEIAEYICYVGINNIKILKDVLGVNLVNLESLKTLNNFEALLFLTSDDYEIRQVINELKFKFIKNQMIKKNEQKLSLGLSIVVDGILYFFKYNYCDKLELYHAINTKSNVFKNDNIMYNVGYDNIKMIYDKFINFEKSLNEYSDKYLDYIKEKLVIDNPYDFNGLDSNLFNYGYMNNKIIKELN